MLPVLRGCRAGLGYLDLPFFMHVCAWDLEVLRSWEKETDSSPFWTMEFSVGVLA